MATCKGKQLAASTPRVTKFMEAVLTFRLRNELEGRRACFLGHRLYTI